MMVYLVLSYPSGGFLAGVAGVYDTLDKAKCHAENSETAAHHKLYDDVDPQSTITFKWRKKQDVYILTATSQWTYEGVKHDLPMDAHWRIEEWQVE